MPKTKTKRVTIHLYIAIIVIESIIEGLLIIPPIFQTASPNPLQLVAFSVWKVVEGALGYYITRG